MEWKRRSRVSMARWRLNKLKGSTVWSGGERGPAGARAAAVGEDKGKVDKAAEGELLLALGCVAVSRGLSLIC